MKFLAARRVKVTPAHVYNVTATSGETGEGLQRQKTKPDAWINSPGHIISMPQE